MRGRRARREATRADRNLLWRATAGGLLLRIQSRPRRPADRRSQMRAMSKAILLLAMMAAWLRHLGVEPARAQAEQHLFVTTAQGQVYGLVQAGIAAFKGIPYAAPPIGELRWRPPQPATPRSDILQAFDYRPRCLQPPMPDAATPETARE